MYFERHYVKIEHQKVQNLAPKWSKNRPKSIQKSSKYENVTAKGPKKCSWRLPGAKFINPPAPKSAVFHCDLLWILRGLKT